MQTIGFIGLGHMGGNMAARYLAAGYTVYGEDRDREEARWLTEQGLRWADSPRAVAEAACASIAAAAAIADSARSEKSSCNSAAGVVPFVGRCLGDLPPALSWARNSIGESRLFCLSITNRRGSAETVAQ